MIGSWEHSLNMYRKIGKEKMTLESILKTVKKYNNEFTLNPKYSTIRYIGENEYKEDVYKYISPKFTEINTKSVFSPKIILFSAPGATGKSALAKYICYSLNGIYWNLSDNKVAEYSFQGSIAEAVGYNYLSNFINSIERGENFLVIDAFDEAEAGSGRTNIEFFLRDLNNVTRNCNHICCILMARTESALFIKHFFNNNSIAYNHFEIGLFERYNAKSYIENKLNIFGIKITPIIRQCIDEQFKEIDRIFSKEDADAFIGYAPVLDALAVSYDEDKNTLNLLKKTENGINNCNLMNNILNKLIEREQAKFHKALRIKIPKLDLSSSIYNLKEQLFKLYSMILLAEPSAFMDEDISIPLNYRDEYKDVVNTQLPQHPFIRVKNNNNIIIYDFAGTVFKDYLIAYILADKDLSDFIDDYISENKYCPSQMLIEFLALFSNKTIKGRYIPLIYSSFKSYAQASDRISVYINGDPDDCSIEFNLIRNETIKISMTFSIIDSENGIYIDQLSNSYIDVDSTLYIGSQNKETRIYNTYINCNEIVWRSNYISIEGYAPGESTLIFDKCTYTTDTLPHFEMKSDVTSNIKIISNNLRGYFKLLAYKHEDILEKSYDNFDIFSNLIRRIFSCLRSHSKDTPARKTDFIDNRIINKNEVKQEVLNFLLTNHILYQDEQKWLYKLDRNKTAELSINWNSVREGNYSSLKLLYNLFMGKTP